jgi:ankyrin repeat protein
VFWLPWVLDMSSSSNIKYLPSELSLMPQSNGSSGATRLLIEADTDYEARGIEGKTPPIHASANSSIAVMQQFRLADVNNTMLDAVDPAGMTGLTHAVREGHIRAMSSLLSYGAALDSRDEDGWAPLLHSALLLQAKILQILIEAEADENVRNEQGQMFLIWAARKGMREMVREVVKLLLKGDLDLNAVDNEGKTAAEWA